MSRQLFGPMGDTGSFVELLWARLTSSRKFSMWDGAAGRQGADFKSGTSGQGQDHGVGSQGMAVWDQGLGQTCNGVSRIHSLNTHACGTGTPCKGTQAVDYGSALGPSPMLSPSQDPGFSLALPAYLTPGYHSLPTHGPVPALWPSALPVQAPPPVVGGRGKGLGCLGSRTGYGRQKEPPLPGLLGNKSTAVLPTQPRCTSGGGRTGSMHRGPVPGASETEGLVASWTKSLSGPHVACKLYFAPPLPQISLI